ncbi:MAG: hypothetical protein E6H01_14530 [Bacillati bacterium ANGP1]|uniref:IPT/TIG domain-containing protein n=1 Tax=Candidatus Segetimicrobium genomatis TaxID=2569760 RepID=A0A537KHS4_9BACT|nr:MAG: hypothetical protein E6H01_14530 [Terrabacteria group bacterium ANGP1]
MKRIQVKIGGLRMRTNSVIALLVGTVLGMSLAAVPAAHAQQFFDDFNRPDSVDIGNGWVEKTPGAFSLAGNQVIKAPTSTGFADNLVYRPSGENMLDGEASVEVRFNSMPPGYAQVFVRGQTSTIANAGVFDGYLLYTDNDPGRALLDRIENGGFAPLTQITINPGLNTVDTFRLRLRATGINPVTLAAIVERFTGTSWTVIGQATVNDTAPTRFATAGSVGFTGFIEGGVYTYDNFTGTSFDGGGGVNPAPTTTGLTPASAVAGSPGFTLTVNGSGFVPASVVQWNGTDRPTTFVSATELTAALARADLAATGTTQAIFFGPGSERPLLGRFQPTGQCRSGQWMDGEVSAGVFHPEQRSRGHRHGDHRLSRCDRLPACGRGSARCRGRDRVPRAGRPELPAGPRPDSAGYGRSGGHAGRLHDIR